MQTIRYTHNNLKINNGKNRRHVKIITLCVCIALVGLGLLTGCQKKSEEGTMRYAWPLATASPEDTVTQIFAERFAQEVDELSGGKMKIQVYPNSVLGGDRELLESCKDADIPFVVQNTAPQVTFMKEVAVFDLPGTFENIEEARRAVDEDAFYMKMKAVYEKAGYELMAYADQGFRVTTSNKPIHSVEDFKGLKIRTMENGNHVGFWKSLGANPTPMTFSEVYIGLQQGTIDAQENPLEIVVSSKLYEQQKYVVETNHLPHYISLIISEAFFKKLSQEDQAIMREAASRAKAYAREEADRRSRERLETLKASGVTIMPFSSDLQEAMREKSRGVYEHIEKEVGTSLIQSYIGK